MRFYTGSTVFVIGICYTRKNCVINGLEQPASIHIVFYYGKE